MDDFLKTYNLPNLTEEEIEILNSSVNLTKEIELINYKYIHTHEKNP